MTPTEKAALVEVRDVFEELLRPKYNQTNQHYAVMMITAKQALATLDEIINKEGDRG